MGLWLFQLNVCPINETRIDVPDFFNVLPHEDALDLLLSKITPTQKTELLATNESVGRVTSCEIHSSEDLPAFPRSSMDGYSVRAADTFGASELEFYKVLFFRQAPDIFGVEI